MNVFLKSSLNKGIKKVINKKISKIKIQKTLKIAMTGMLNKRKDGSSVKIEKKIE